jgi:hypothetical protein
MNDTASDTAQTILKFSSSNHKSNYIKSLDEKIVYRVSTTGKSPNEVTSIYRQFNGTIDSVPADVDASTEQLQEVQNKQIASVEWKFPDGDDILRLGDAEAFPQKLDKWLKRGAFSGFVLFSHTDLRLIIQDFIGIVRSQRRTTPSTNGFM